MTAFTVQHSYCTISHPTTLSKWEPGTGCDTCEQQLWEYFQLFSLQKPPWSNDLPLTPNLNSLIKILQGLHWQFEEFFLIITAEMSIPPETWGSIPPPKVKLSINHRRKEAAEHSMLLFTNFNSYNTSRRCAHNHPVWSRRPQAPQPLSSGFLSEDSAIPALASRSDAPR